MHNGLRFELARVYIRRNQDITDEVQAMCLLEQLVPAMAPLLGQREDLVRVLNACHLLSLRLTHIPIHSTHRPTQNPQ